MIDRRFYNYYGPMSLKKIIELTGVSCPIPYEETYSFEGVAPLETASPHDVTCLHNVKYKKDLILSKAGACFLKEKDYDPATCHAIPLFSKTPYAAFALLLRSMYPLKKESTLIHPTSVIHESVVIGGGVSVGPYTVIEEGCTIGQNTSIGPHCVIKHNTEIGSGCVIESHVSIEYTLMGNHCYIQTGARIGSAGFGFDITESGPIDVPQLGLVLIEDNVRIGANTCIDRGSLSNTLIKQGTRIDNLVQIAHNVCIGSNCVLVAQVGIAGSTELKSFVVAGGQVGISGHLIIDQGVQIAAQSGVMKNLKKGEIVGGSPCVPIYEWHRQTVALSRLSKKAKNEQQNTKNNF